jgi:hypothetical protein
MKNQWKAIAINKEALLTLVLLIGVAIVAPMFIKQQLITGTIVNATLIIGVSLLGARDGLLIGLLPSSIALATGLLSPALAPMIPFIIIGNALLVLTFGYLSRINFWMGAIAGSILKFVFLYGTSTVVIGLLVNKQVAPAVAQMLSWPQLVTALAGSVLAFGVVRILKNSSVARLNK